MVVAFPEKISRLTVGESKPKNILQCIASWCRCCCLVSVLVSYHSQLSLECHIYPGWCADTIPPMSTYPLKQCFFPNQWAHKRSCPADTTDMSTYLPQVPLFAHLCWLNFQSSKLFKRIEKSKFVVWLIIETCFIYDSEQILFSIRNIFLHVFGKQHFFFLIALHHCWHYPLECFTVCTMIPAVLKDLIQHQQQQGFYMTEINCSWLHVTVLVASADHWWSS